MSDVNKHLEQARRSLEKNKLREAAAEYQAVFDEAPSNQEALQALADLYTRLNEPAQAAQYYGIQFDKLIDTGDAAKASAVFARFLRQFPQPPDRLMRYAMLLQKQNRSAEAIEQFGIAADGFQQQQRDVEALACYESMALLDPENPRRHVILADLASKLKHADLATRSYLRAGQLTLASGALDEALEYFERAHKLSPEDRSGALLYAEAKLRKGDAEAAVTLLDPFSPSDKDTSFLALLGEALLRTGRLDRARETFEAYYKQKPDSFGKLFELAGAYVRSGQDDKAAAVLNQTKEWMRGARKEIELSAQMDRIAAAYPISLSVAQTVARLYEELNRETKYFDSLVRLFDLYLAAGRMKEACDALDRLVDIDPYDYRNHERIAKLEGKVDPGFLQNILARAAKAATVSTRTDGFTRRRRRELGCCPRVRGTARTTGPRRPDRAGGDFRSVRAPVESRRAPRTHCRTFSRRRRAKRAPSRSVRACQLVAQGSAAQARPHRNPRRSLLLRSCLHPPPAPAPVVEPAPAPVPVPSPAETHRDLAAIAEINRLMYRQPTPREVLATTAAEIGKHLGVTRCLVSVGDARDSGQLTAEYSAPGVSAAGVPRVAALAALVSKASPDPFGGVELHSSSAPALRELAVDSALGVILMDKDTQAPAGALIVADAKPRKWKPNESFFLQAVGDQLVLSVNHTRLRSLVRSLAVADEKTGLLSRGAYIDCLLSESNRARSQGTPLSLIVLHIDRGGDLLRQHGDAAVDQYIEQLARALSSAVRQTDIAVKYTAWSLVFILPDTSLRKRAGPSRKAAPDRRHGSSVVGRGRLDHQRRRRRGLRASGRRNRRPRHRMDQPRRSRPRRGAPARRRHTRRPRNSLR